MISIITIWLTLGILKVLVLVIKTKNRKYDKI